MDQRLVIGMTGATGQVFGQRILSLLVKTEYETHLILSESSKMTIEHELNVPVADIVNLADEVHSIDNIGAETASGSFKTEGMIIAPCSMKTLSNIAHGDAGNLITRSADVTLKERRPLVLMPREKPLNRIHLENMLKVTDAGGIIMPPFPSFYQIDDDLDKSITRTAARTLALLNIETDFQEWGGL